jgi:hypothetical protein
MASAQQEGTDKRNPARTSFVLGITSFVLALFNFAPGLLSTLACAGAAASVFAIIAGIQGMRAARELEGQQRNTAIIGMAAALLGLAIFLGVMISGVIKGISLAENLT